MAEEKQEKPPRYCRNTTRRRGDGDGEREMTLGDALLVGTPSATQFPNVDTSSRREAERPRIGRIGTGAREVKSGANSQASERAAARASDTRHVRSEPSQLSAAA